MTPALSTPSQLDQPGHKRHTALAVWLWVDLIAFATAIMATVTGNNGDVQQVKRLGKKASDM